MANEPTERPYEDEVLASIMDEATLPFQKLLPPELYEECRHDVGLMMELNPELGSELDLMRRDRLRVKISGPMVDGVPVDEATQELKTKHSA